MTNDSEENVQAPELAADDMPYQLFKNTHILAMHRVFFFFKETAPPRDLPSSPPRRSPDLGAFQPQPLGCKRAECGLVVTPHADHFVHRLDRRADQAADEVLGIGPYVLLEFPP